LIDRFVNGSHAALTELPNYAIASLEDCFGRQHPGAIIHGLQPLHRLSAVFFAGMLRA
jgi:hypothetical protein